MQKNLNKFFGSLLFIFFYNLAYEQKIDSNLIIKKIPLKEGYVIFKDSIVNHGSPSDGVRVFSNNSFKDSVFSLFDGFVYSIHEEDKNFIYTIKSSQYSVTYAFLSDSKFKKGSTVRKGDYIGDLNDSKMGKKSLQLIISNNKKILSFKEHLTLLVNL